VPETPLVRLGAGAHGASEEQFFPGTIYDPAIARPESALSEPAMVRPAHHAEVLELWRTWASQSPRVRLERYGRTYEGRELVWGAISAPENIARLEEIREAHARLADPRGLDPDEAERLVAETPAVAWIGCSIHGDEMSGVDGGLALAHHLIAGTSAEVTELLRQIVVVIDPIQNPDGRERYLAMLEASSGLVPNLDAESLQRGRWPYGRGNHYLFDMNRDWMAGIAPETRGRWRAVRSFHPQLFVDAHEMAPLDTFLFYPQAKPYNPALPASLFRWQEVFAADQAAAFDAHGWSYYTREWADAWGPFYSDAWGSLSGAIGILYEQARFAGQSLRRASGEVVTYREAVHHRAVSGLANVSTLAQHRQEILRTQLQDRRAVLESPGDPGPGRRALFVFATGRHTGREAYLLDTLLAQGIEAFALEAGSKLRGVVSARGERTDEVELAGPAWCVPAQQPMGLFVRAFLDFDPRYDKEALTGEREELEREDRSKIYDATAWDFAHALDLEAWWCDSIEPEGARAPLASVPPRPSGVVPPAQAAPIYGWVVDGEDDASVAFAVRAMELALDVHFADEAFASAGRDFARGSLLVRRHESGEGAAAQVERAARDAGVQAFATTSARAPADGADLGGWHFHLLARPRVALASNAPVSEDEFGHVWHLFDRTLALPATMVDVQALSEHDLRRYNVLVLPPASGLGALLEPIAEELRAWVLSGGTLVALGSSAAALADEELGLSQVRLREDVLGELDAYLREARREQAALHVEVDEHAVWEGEPAAKEELAEPATDGHERDEKEDEDARRHDEWLRRFDPQGVYLRARVDTESWVTAGADEQMPVFIWGPHAFLSRSPVRTPVRLAPEGELRLAGLVWPEARQRLAESAYLTLERVGHGQVILFAGLPGYRGYNQATARLLANAVVYGPGLGAEATREW